MGTKPVKMILARVHCALSVLLLVLVLVQAALAGQFLFSGGSIAVHGYIANGSFAVGLVLLVLTILARLPRGVLALVAVLVVVLFAQVGLGYAGRTSGTAASLHVPLGVLTFGVSTALAGLSALYAGGVLPARRNP